MATINTRGLLTDIAENYLLFIQDISDLTDSPDGTSKKTEPQYLELWLKREVGQVKINTGNSVQPSFVLTANTPQIFSYASPLGLSSFPTTTWPQMVGTATDGDIVDFTNGTFLENLRSGQKHVWRFEFGYSGKPNNQTCGVVVRFYNSISGFERFENVFLSENLNTGGFKADFITIADSASLPSPLGSGQGYALEVTSELGMTVTLKDSTRFSDAHNAYAVAI
jgi:hypothetical protein